MRVCGKGFVVEVAFETYVSIVLMIHQEGGRRSLKGFVRRFDNENVRKGHGIDAFCLSVSACTN